MKNKQFTITVPAAEHARLVKLAKRNFRSLSAEVNAQLEIAKTSPPKP